MQSLKVLIFLTILPFSLPLPCLQAQSSSPFFKWAVYDAAELVGNVDGKTILYGAGGLGLVSIFSLLDDPIQDKASAGVSDFANSYADIANLLGEPLFVIPTTLGIFGISLLTDNFEFQDAAFTSIQSLVYASSATIALKFLFGRARPASASSPYQFSPLSGNDAFPSGHATAAFAMLVPWAMYYPSVVTWSLVGIAAGGTAFARIALNKHWLSDVIAGSAIGFTTAVLLSRKHQKARDVPAKHTSSLHFVPILVPGNQGVQISYSF